MNVGECRYLELTVSITKSTKFTIYPSDFAGGYEGENAYAVANKATGEAIATVGINTFTISEAGTYTLVLKLTKTATVVLMLQKIYLSVLIGNNLNSKKPLVKPMTFYCTLKISVIYNLICIYLWKIRYFML